jgi:tRNA-dihydrouridine synthase A
MLDFVRAVNEAAPDRFTVHARIAILSGLSPKENRSVPPLRYEDVYRLKAEASSLQIELNGGVHTLDDVAGHLGHVDAVMIGRAAYDNPWMLHEADERFFGAGTATTRDEVVNRMVPYIRSWQAAGWHPRSILRHMLGLYAFEPGARRFRRRLSGHIPDDADGGQVLLDAARAVPGMVA